MDMDANEVMMRIRGLQEQLESDRKKNKPSTETVKLLAQLGSLMSRIGMFEDSLRVQTQARTLLRQLSGGSEEGELGAEVASSLGVCYSRFGRWAEALEHHRRAEAITLAVFGSRSYRYASCLSNIASVQQKQGDMRGAMTNYGVAVRVAGNDESCPSEIFASMLNNFGMCCVNVGMAEQGEGILRRGLALTIEQSGEASMPAATAMNNLGTALSGVAEWSKALLHFESALRVLLQFPKMPETAMCYANIGECLLRCRETERALEVLQKGVEYARTLAHPRLVASMLDSLGMALLVHGDLTQARDVLEEAKADFERDVDPDPTIFAVFMELAQTYWLLGEKDKARALESQAQEWRKKCPGVDPEDVFTIRGDMKDTHEQFVSYYYDPGRKE